jgi:hypothetical protein
MAISVFLELPEKLVNARLDEEIIFFRQQKLNSKKKSKFFLFDFYCLIF